MQQDLEFITDRLIIRALKKADLDSFQQTVVASSDTVGPWLDWCHEGFDSLEADAWICRSRQNWLTGTCYEMLVLEKESQQIIGAVYLSQIDTSSNMANLGYWIHSEYQGCGFAVEAANVVINIAFSHLLLTRLELVMAPDNIASKTVAERLGATFECKARNRIIYNGQPFDGLVYSLVPADILD
ncbi:GNAT family N-acetyltransferase [Veronia pacifica]|uniref:Ribosomal-protein-serine acetyltransferase n=1 Tax=Veronia pacifica TaxID=1080227 RepID=A0A1C3EG19_9GAMM|nr:GNAT family protein [Veronia pacifica]ODA32206.1 ribosomal-protein-serine acetyltransferase [Veronia pacifica]